MRILKTIIYKLTGLYLIVWGQWAYSQQVEMISGSSQSWSGGVCCRSGVHYEFNFRVLESGQNIKWDTLWVDTYAHCLEDITVKKEEDTMWVSVRLSYIKNGGEMFYTGSCAEDSKKTGVWLVYRIGENRYELELTHQMEELPYLAYP